jgi:hypothetical protein
MADYQFPTEIVDLPSKGYFYPETSPLSSGKVELKYMTAKEEDILTSITNYQSQIVKLLLNYSMVRTKKTSMQRSRPEKN